MTICWRTVVRSVSSAAHRVGDADALEHAEDAPVQQPVAHPLEQRRVGDAGDVAPREVGEAVDEEPEQEDQRAAADDLARGSRVRCRRGRDAR